MVTRVTISTDVAAFTRNSNPSHAWKLWRSRLGPGLRTALACLIVGCTTIYGPASICRQLTFPAFSYVTAVLLVGEATLGDALHGAFCALYATILAMPTTVLSLWLTGTGGLSIATTTMGVTLCSFVVTLPESANLIAKRIALGQIVLVYGRVLKQGRGTTPILHPGHVATSTMVGVAAAVLAVILPYPRLADREVRKKKEEFVIIVTEKLKNFLVAFCAADKTSAFASFSQANLLSKEVAKLIQDIKMKQGALQWEKPQINFSADQSRLSSDTLHTLDLLLEGMKIALSTTDSFPIKMLTPELACLLHNIESDISLILMGKDNQNVKKQMENAKTCSIPIKDTITLHRENLPPLFFLFCLKMLFHEILEETKQTPIHKASLTESSSIPEHPTTVKASKTLKIKLKWEPFMVALKCSLSMGLAVLLGVLYSKYDAYWSGLTVATAITIGREATFKFANLRAQGTALGSIYGIIGALISPNLMEVRFLVLLPWITFTSFLKQSKIYGQAGGMAAAISAILILGRRNYGTPTSFAIVRITETFIGLLSSIFIEVLLQPTRAATLARSKLCQSIQSLNECVELLISSSTPGMTPVSLMKIKEKVKKLMVQIHELRKLSVDAEGEPNFLFLPFPCSTYAKLQGSLTRMAELLVFTGQALQFLLHSLNENGIEWDKYQIGIKEKLELLNMAGKSIMCFRHVMQITSLVTLDNELQRRKISDDPEMASTTYPGRYGMVNTDVEKHDEYQGSVLHQMVDFTMNHNFEDDAVRNQVILNLGALVFSIEYLAKETKELEKSIVEIIQLENPSKCVNLYEIYNKINNVCKE